MRTAPTPPTREPTATLLRQARRRSGLTIRQLAARASTSHSAIAAYESGRRQPSSATEDRLLAACGFRVERRLRGLDQFEDRSARGRALVEVLDLADQFPARHRPHIAARFAPA